VRRVFAGLSAIDDAETPAALDVEADANLRSLGNLK
jgi:hypothetical protein